MKRFLCFILAVVCVLATACVLPSNGNVSVASAAGEESEELVPVKDIAEVHIDISTSIIRESYRDCAIRVIDVYGNVVEDKDSSIKIRGNSTSSGAKKPYNFKFSGKTEILGMGKAKKWCLLANCYEKTLFRNEMVFDFARNSTVLQYTPDSRFVDVYLNGVLQGNYILCEAVEASSSRVNIDIDNGEYLIERDVREDEDTVYIQSPLYGIRFGINEPEEPTQAQTDELERMLYKAEKALDSRNISEIEKYFDIESIVDFYIVLEYFKQVDVSVGSTRFYIKNGKIYGGPVWDFDLTMGNCLASYYTVYNNVGGSGKSCEGIYCNVDWFRYFNLVPEFEKMRNERYLELQSEIVNLYTDTGVGKNYMDTVLDTYGDSFARNYDEAGWKVDVVYSSLERIPDKTYEQNVAYLRTWLRERNEWMLKNWGLDSQNTVSAKSDSGITLDEAFVYGLKEGVAEKDCAKLFNQSVTFNTVSGKVGTGSTVKNGGMEYTFIVLGDINGNGKVDANDYMLVKRHFLGTYELDNIGFAAGDCNGDGKISANDYFIIRRHVIGTYDIYK
ncbi:MAG: CotH kinase family protein [Clostridia bacterium]|nr:CotH kinase family protein [Clostridia bacterium]